MKIKIACDSAADLTKELCEKNEISVIPFAVMMGEKEYRDGVDLTAQMIFKHVEENKALPKTAAINQAEFEDFFKEIKKGYDAVIYFSLSSGLSSSCEHAAMAAEAVGDVYVIDSKSLSTGIAVQILYACSLRDKGAKPEEIVEKVLARRDKVQASFITYKLDYLHKGGRCSSLTLLGANLLKIRPSIILSNGKMQMHKKYMGRPEKVNLEYLKDTITEFNTPDNTCCFITYSSITSEMLDLFKNFIKENTNFKKVYEVQASATITSHCGENTIGLLYYNDGK